MSRIFGQIAQIGYVVHDIRASMDNWARAASGRGSTLTVSDWTTSDIAASTPTWK